MEFITEDKIHALSNPGIASLQLLSHHNSNSSRMTITRVTVQPGASQPPHAHKASEQVWVAVSGSGNLLVAEGDKRRISAGEVVRFADGEIHGFENTRASLSCTCQ